MPMAPVDQTTERQVRRAVARAERGASLDPAEAAALLAARGEDLTRLCVAAARVRDAGLAAAGRADVVTFSPKVFIPVTRLCRDRCHYCTFVTTPGQLARSDQAAYLDPDEILTIASAGARSGCLEALFTLGDRPEARWPEAAAWLAARGYDSTLDYVRAMAVRVLEETGLLPHVNPGVMSWEELSRLKPVSPSMGMMLETTSERLHSVPGLAHHGSPDKAPSTRLRVLEDAGRLSIPFTTGLLVGIGEDLTERAETIFALRRVSRSFSGIQEVIVQNFRAKTETAMRHVDRPAPRRLPGDDRRHPSGARSAGAGPGAPEPRRPRRVPRPARRGGGRLGWRLAGDPRPRQPRTALALARGPAARDRGRRPRAAGATDRASRLRAGGRAVDRPPRRRPTSLPSRAPTGWRGTGCDRSGAPGRSRTAVSCRPAASTFTPRWTPRAAVPTDGATSTSCTATGTRSARRPRSPEHLPCCTPREGDALRAAETDPGNLSDADALRLMTAEGELLRQVTRLADDLRREAVGDEVTYVVNRNINFTNVCYVGCRFCAFAQRRTDSDAYSLSLDEVADRAEEAWKLGATRGVHAGRDRPRAARHRLLRPRGSGEGPGARDARARVLADGGGQRDRADRTLDRGLPGQGS